jgi:hypothetical protein
MRLGVHGQIWQACSATQRGNISTGIAAQLSISAPTSTNAVIAPGWVRRGTGEIGRHIVYPPSPEPDQQACGVSVVAIGFTLPGYSG